MPKVQGTPYGVVGTARLPRTVAGDHSAPLIIELTIDPDTNVVVDVASTLQLPCFQKLLLGLVGINLHELEAAAHNAFAHYRGPLLRPTLAALSNALANAQDLAPAGSPVKQSWPAESTSLR